jgi:hypothetical protein
VSTATPVCRGKIRADYDMRDLGGVVSPGSSTQPEGANHMGHNNKGKGGDTHKKQACSSWHEELYDDMEPFPDDDIVLACQSPALRPAASGRRDSHDRELPLPNRITQKVLADYRQLEALAAMYRDLRKYLTAALEAGVPVEPGPNTATLLRRESQYLTAKHLIQQLALPDDKVAALRASAPLRASVMLKVTYSASS